jgi:hypothetical protein
MAIFALNFGVGQAGVDHVRQNKQRNHDGWRIDDVGMQQQERQRRGEEHQTRDPERKCSMALT